MAMAPKGGPRRQASSSEFTLPQSTAQNDPRLPQLAELLDTEPAPPHERNREFGNDGYETAPSQESLHPKASEAIPSQSLSKRMTGDYDKTKIASDMTRGNLPFIPWRVCFRGFEIVAQESSDGTALLIKICAAELPHVILRFQEPLPARTYVFLPGGQLTLEFSRVGEVSVASATGPHSEDKTRALRRIDHLMDKLFDQDELLYCQNLAGVRSLDGKKEYYLCEITAGKLMNTDEALVSLSMYKYHTDKSN